MQVPTMDERALQGLSPLAGREGQARVRFIIIIFLLFTKLWLSRLIIAIKIW